MYFLNLRHPGYKNRIFCRLQKPIKKKLHESAIPPCTYFCNKHLDLYKSSIQLLIGAAGAGIDASAAGVGCGEFCDVAGGGVSVLGC